MHSVSVFDIFSQVYSINCILYTFYTVYREVYSKEKKTSEIKLATAIPFKMLIDSTWLLLFLKLLKLIYSYYEKAFSTNYNSKTLNVHTF